ELVFVLRARRLPPRRLSPYPTLFRSHLYRDRVVVATSATLALGGAFDTIARTLGLPAAPAKAGVDRPPAGSATVASGSGVDGPRSEEHTSELQSREKLVCRLLREKKK